jgi:Ca2+-binding RTX toxin-like protein
MVEAGDGDDALIGDGRWNWLYGGAGNDHIEGRGGNDHLDGGGHDAEGGDLLNGGDGKDTCVEEETVLNCELP